MKFFIILTFIVIISFTTCQFNQVGSNSDWCCCGGQHCPAGSTQTDMQIQNVNLQQCETFTNSINGQAFLYSQAISYCAVVPLSYQQILVENSQNNPTYNSQNFRCDCTFVFFVAPAAPPKPVCNINNCQTCVSGNANECQTCNTNLQPSADQTQCFSCNVGECSQCVNTPDKNENYGNQCLTCQTNLLPSADQTQCFSCNVGGCSQCVNTPDKNGNYGNQCLTCQTNLLPSADQTQCFSCNVGECSQCVNTPDKNGNYGNQCQICNSGYLLQNYQCIKDCGNGKYLNKTNQICYSCSYNWQATSLPQSWCQSNCFSPGITQAQLSLNLVNPVCLGQSALPNTCVCRCLANDLDSNSNYQVGGSGTNALNCFVNPITQSTGSGCHTLQPTIASSNWCLINACSVNSVTGACTLKAFQTICSC